MIRRLGCGLALGALVGCGQPEDPPPPPPADTGNPPPPPTEILPVGSPLWEIGEFALFTGPADEGTARCLLDGPHAWTGQVWGPGTPHDPPYTQELHDGLAGCGLVEREGFSPGEMQGGNGIWLGMILTPVAGNAPGSSPDFGLGDVIYEDRFPMVVDADVRRDGIPVDTDNDLIFPGTTALGFVVTGHSHVPLLFRTSLERMPAGASAEGDYTWQVAIRDDTSVVAESGYDFTLAYTVGTDPTAAE